MATTTTRAKKGTADHLQDALADLDKARDSATEEARAGIDSARERIEEAREDLSQRGHDRLAEWQDALTEAAENMRRELGRAAIRAQGSPEALAEMSDEIKKRRTQLGH
jgi:hypothetical protein